MPDDARTAAAAANRWRRPVDAFFGSAAVRRIVPAYRRLRHGMTLGVRIAALENGRVVLVRHGYTPGWHFPGGGVDLGETAAACAIRELREETGCIAAAEPILHGLYFNPAYGGRDHIAMFVLRAFTHGERSAPASEIAETGSFPLADLPEGTSAATRRRLAEIAAGGDRDPRW